MKGKIFGIPLVLILLLVAILVPTLYADYLILFNISKASEQVSAICVQAQATSPEVVATPSAVQSSPSPVKRVMPVVSPVVSPAVVR